jgi:hypothetical protein
MEGSAVLLSSFVLVVVLVVVFFCKLSAKEKLHTPKA